MPKSHSSRTRWYSMDPHGRLFASNLTCFFCAGLQELGYCIDDLMDGRVVWNSPVRGEKLNGRVQLRRVIFEDDRKKVESRLRVPMPSAHLLWAEANPESQWKREDWYEWFLRAGGPVQGWLYKRLHKSTSKGWVPSLDSWPGSKDPFGPMLLEPQLVEVNSRRKHRKRWGKDHENAVLKMQGGACGNCGRPIGYTSENHDVERFELDHVLALAHCKEADVFQNLWALCVSCHERKSLKSLARFLTEERQARLAQPRGRRG